MPLSITCDCGARFDVDDLLVGQEVPCPECTDPVKVSGQAAAPRTSLWALAALVTALVGGLIPGGGIVAILVGLVALLILLRRRKQLTGQWIALTAIGLGIFGSTLTAALFVKPDLLPVGDWLRERALAGQFDNTGELLLPTRNNDATLDLADAENKMLLLVVNDEQQRILTDRQQKILKLKLIAGKEPKQISTELDLSEERVSAEIREAARRMRELFDPRDWGTMRRGYSFDPTISELQVKQDQQGQAVQKPRADLLLFNPRRNTYVDVIRDSDTTGVSLQSYQDVLAAQLNPHQQRFLGGDEGGLFDRRNQPGPGGGQPEHGENFPQFDERARDLEKLDGHFGREWRATVKRGGQTWRFIIRAYKKPGVKDDPNSVGPIYVFRAYVPLSRFKANEKQLTAILDSAHIKP